MVKWFCRLCWRTGSLEFGDMGMAGAVAAHVMAVNADLNPQKTPNPTKLPPNHPMMQKFPGEYCGGDVHLGETQTRKRFKPATDNMLNFEDQPAETGSVSE